MSGLRRVLALLLVAGTGACGGSSSPPGAPETPPPPPAARMTRGPYLQWAGDGSVAVAWYQDTASPGRVEWRPEGGTWQEAAATGSGQRYEATLDALAAATTHWYRVRAGAGGPLPDAAGRTDFSFRTPRREVARLVFMGDTGTGEPRQYQVAARLAMEDPLPDAVTIVGDVVYEHGEDAGYDARFFAPYRSLLPAVPFLAALGNHDYETSSGAPLLGVFTLPRNGPSALAPESAYWWERGGVLTIVHNTNLPTSTLRDVALPWHATVARRAALFRLAVLHHPPYSSGPNAKDPPSPAIKALFPPVLSASGIDLVLSGHEHFYERTKPMDGVVYVVTGNGGQNPYARESWNAFTAVFDNTADGYTVVEVQGRQLALRHIAADGRQVDSFLLSKPLLATDPVEVLAARAPGEAPRVRATFQIERPWLAETVTLRLLGERTVAAALNGTPLALAEGRQESDGFAVFEVSPGRVLPGRNEIEIETRGEAGRAPRAPVAEMVVLERAVP